ncbi:MAG: PTS sugar transporter subunit IIA [Schwartzia sp. (in: firmicutes)]
MMLGFGKKTLRVAAPLKGRVMDITAVPDPVFSEKMLGDGFAVEPSPEETTVAAPCAGEVILVAETRHAVALCAQGVELLLHVGLDTAVLGGEGFQALVGVGDRVMTGQPLLSFDRGILEAKGKSLITALVVTNAAEAVSRMEKDLAHPSAALTVTVK